MANVNGEHDDGRSMLEQCAPETISKRTLAHMDEAMRQMAEGNVGDEFDLSEVEDLVGS